MKIQNFRMAHNAGLGHLLPASLPFVPALIGLCDCSVSLFVAYFWPDFPVVPVSFLPISFVIVPAADFCLMFQNGKKSPKLSRRSVDSERST